MSFTFKWPRFSEQFHADAIQMLESALNKGNKPPVIADKIEVVELEMGTQPPELEIRDIGELTLDQFRGIFRLTYAGDAHLVLRTKVQANPLNHKQPDIHLMSGSRGMLAAKQPLVVPMLLRLSHFKLNSYVVLVVSKQKGITLVFKTDPLQSVDINSTFDSIAVIQKYIQREIEGQLRQMFREDLPGIIHRLSQQWVKAKVEAPYLSKRPVPPNPRQNDMETMSLPELPRAPRLPPLGLHPMSLRRQTYSGTQGYNTSRSSSNLSVASTSRTMAPSYASTSTEPVKSPPRESPASFPDIEDFDPTYGLRPDGLPTKSLFSGFGRLFSPNRGLADLAEEPNGEGDLDEVGSNAFDFVDWEDTLPDYSAPPSVAEGDPAEYETIPAVGGGTITRPRVLHSQSQILPSRSSRQSPDGSSTRSSHAALSRMAQSMMATPSPLPMSSAFSTPGPSRLRGTATPSFNPYFPSVASQLSQASSDALSYGQPLNSHRYPDPTMTPFTPSSRPRTPPLYRSPRRPSSPDSSRTLRSQSSSDLTQSVLTPPFSEYANADEDDPYLRRHAADRRFSPTNSTLDAFQSGSPIDTSHHIPEPDPKIVLRPAMNNSVSQLSTLSHSNHTLSPYTRSLEHFTVRSVPRRGGGQAGKAATAEKQPAKAKRKRRYRLGGPSTAGTPPTQVPPPPSSPVPPSEFDQSDMDHYFRPGGDLSPRYPTFPHDSSSYVRRRYPHPVP